jgi:hypothetical protein
MEGMASVRVVEWMAEVQMGATLAKAGNAVE